MNKKAFSLFFTVSILLIAGYLLWLRQTAPGSKIVSYKAELKKQEVKLYWKDENGEMFQSLGRLKAWLKTGGKDLLFAMNAGMFKPNHSPQGLFIQEGKTIAPLDTATGSGNFYLKPNGVFYITKDQRGFICTSEQFQDDGSILYATQSGPMLVIDGHIHSAFREGSANLQIRNGVGLLPDGDVIFAISKKEINFYDFAAFFKSLGCLNALYLDGFVSRMYLPEKDWVQTDGNLGVIIGVTATK